MKKEISAGCQVSNAVILAVLTIEYGLYFLERDFSVFSILLLLGYSFLTYAITCNNHERSVHLQYERELSLLLKCLLTDLIMAVFLLALFCERQDYLCRGFFKHGYPWWQVYLLMMGLHLLSILLLCIFWNKVVYPGKRGRILFIYEEQRPEDLRENDMLISAYDTSGRLEELIGAYHRIFIYDVSAEKRNDILKYCFAEGKDVYITAKLSDVQLRYSYLTQNCDRSTYYCQKPELSRRAAVIKRILDVAGALVGIVVLLPLFLLIALLIRLEDHGPVFFRQERCTQRGRRFEIIKFRSMRMDADEQEPGLAEYKDDRFTRVGFFLRKWKLDEWPQLVNILKGDMSFVGPRPERPELIEQIVRTIPEFEFRTTVKAGLTGYAQVHGDYHTDFLEKLKWDLIYIENYSLLLDIKIILMTIPVIFRGSDEVKR